MKKLCIFLALGLLFSATAYGQLKVVGNGATVSINTSAFPSKMQAAYDVMQKKCGRCHTMERVIVAVRTGLCPLSKMNFTKDTAKSIVVRMFLKPESNMTRDDVKAIVELLNYMIDETAKGTKEVELVPPAGPK